MEKELPKLRKSTPSTKRARKKRKASNRLVSHQFRILHDDDDDIPFRIGTDSNERARGDPLSFARNRISVWKNRAIERANANEGGNSNEKTDLQTQDVAPVEVKTEENDAGKECCSETSEVQAVIEHVPLECSQTKVRFLGYLRFNGVNSLLYRVSLIGA